MSCSYHDCAVLRAASNDMVIMRTPLDVQHWACVTTYCRVGLVYTASLQHTAQAYYKEVKKCKLRQRSQV